jgi:Repeat of Unknown Function (DUF347)
VHRRWWSLNATVAFWTAYVRTRPLGASFADYFGKPTSAGGLGLGDGLVGGGLLAVIVVLVTYLGVTKVDVRPSGPPSSTPARVPELRVLDHGEPVDEEPEAHDVASSVQTR